LADKKEAGQPAFFLCGSLRAEKFASSFDGSRLNTGALGVLYHTGALARGVPRPQAVCIRYQQNQQDFQR
jgi:hypothetical protein